jgi:hypothetical protein
MNIWANIETPFLEKAQTTAQEALGSVKQMATEAQKVITDEVKTKSA